MGAFNANSPREAFEYFAKSKPQWTDELETLAIGYLSFLTFMDDGNDPIAVLESCAAASALVKLAHKVHWIDEAALNALKTTALNARDMFMKRFAGAPVFVQQSPGGRIVTRIDSQDGNHSTH